MVSDWRASTGPRRNLQTAALRAPCPLLALPVGGARGGPCPVGHALGRAIPWHGCARTGLRPSGPSPGGCRCQHQGLKGRLHRLDHAECPGRLLHRAIAGQIRPWLRPGPRIHWWSARAASLPVANLTRRFHQRIRLPGDWAVAPSQERRLGVVPNGCARDAACEASARVPGALRALIARACALPRRQVRRSRLLVVAVDGCAFIVRLAADASGLPWTGPLRDRIPATAACVLAPRLRIAPRDWRMRIVTPSPFGGRHRVVRADAVR